MSIYYIYLQARPLQDPVFKCCKENVEKKNFFICNIINQKVLKFTHNSNNF